MAVKVPVNQSSSTIRVISTQKKWALAVADYIQAIAINPNYLLSYSDSQRSQSFRQLLNKS
ncbi:hypothetical protein [Anabaena sp. CS-542/02]|uniref:hypothetical protein n=1 Tax=Anabaena sp. CS-542/02 TaxID=3021719 RepID=UPI00232F85F9|nr:hypothetical protein [Anabaena sp. CS-542/02]